MQKIYEKLLQINFLHVNEWFSETENLLKDIRSRGEYILISQFDGIGDAILLSGVIKEIKEHYQLPLIVACYDFCVPVFELSPYIDKIIFLPFHSINHQGIIDKIYNELWLNNLFIKRAFHFQCFEINNAAILFNYLSGAEERIGFCEYTINKKELTEIEQLVMKRHTNDHDHLLLTHMYYCPRQITHTVDRYYYLLETYLNKQFNHDLYIYPQQTDVTKYMNKDKKNIVVNLGASLPFKRYPQKQLNTFLSKIDNENIILIGGKDTINKYITCNHVDLVNKTSLIESIDLINNCDLYIGNDTGLTHIAAACKKLSLVFYKESIDSFQYFPERLSSYLQFKPYKTKCICLRPEKRLIPCSRKNYIYSGCGAEGQNHCIRQIKPEEVLQAYKAIMSLI